MKKITFTFGRLNPPTIGHEKLATKVNAVAKSERSDSRIYLSHTQNSKKDPLDYNTKYAIASKAFGDIIHKSDARTPVDIMQELEKDGYTDVTLVVGSDRLRAFDFLKRYNGKDYKFDSINIVSAGQRDPDAEGVEGMSASKMRALAKEGNFKEFKRGLPRRVQGNGKQIYDKLRTVMEENENEQLDEYTVLTPAQRIKRGRMMKRLAKKMARTRKIRAKRMADAGRLQKRARKQAIQKLRDKYAGSTGKGYKGLGRAQKVSVDKLVSRQSSKIERLAKRLLPKVRKAEVERLKRVRSMTKEEMDMKTFGNLFEVRQDPQIKDREGSQPAKYHSGLKKSTKQKRDAQFQKGADMSHKDPSAYPDKHAGDETAKTRTSKHTKKYHNMFGETYELTEGSKEALQKKADKSGIPYSILKKVYDRGMAAWRTGHRPGAGQEQWAYARVNSFITKGKGTWGKADADLAKQVNEVISPLSKGTQKHIDDVRDANDKRLQKLRAAKREKNPTFMDKFKKGFKKEDTDISSYDKGYKSGYGNEKFNSPYSIKAAPKSFKSFKTGFDNGQMQRKYDATVGTKPTIPSIKEELELQEISKQKKKENVNQARMDAMDKDDQATDMQRKIAQTQDNDKKLQYTAMRNKLIKKASQRKQNADYVDDQMEEQKIPHVLDPRKSLKHSMKDIGVDVDSDGDVDVLDKMLSAPPEVTGTEKSQKKIQQALQKRGEVEKKHTKVGVAYEAANPAQQAAIAIDMKEKGKKPKSFKEMKEACWKGYKQEGMKKKGDKVVPNCVPVNEISQDTLDSYKKKAEPEADTNMKRKSGMYSVKRREMGIHQMRVDRRKAQNEETETEYEWDEERMDIIGQNGNNGEHYEEIDEGVLTDLIKDIAKVVIPKKVWHKAKRAQHAEKYKIGVEEYRRLKNEVRKAGGAKQWISSKGLDKGARLMPGMIDNYLKGAAAEVAGISQKEFDAVLDKKTRYEEYVAEDTQKKNLKSILSKKKEAKSNAGAGEWGTDELVRNYVKDTPGMSIDKWKDGYVPKSEAIEYHTENGLALKENVYRPHSNKYYEFFREARALWEAKELEITDPFDIELLQSDIGEFGIYEEIEVPLDMPMMEEDEKNPPLGKPKRGGSKKFYVYVKDPSTGNIKKVSFGDTTGLKAKIDNPEARKSFVARHQCSQKTDKTKPGYWACRLPRYAKELGLSGGGSFFW